VHLRTTQHPERLPRAFRIGTQMAAWFIGINLFEQAVRAVVR
jgi:hypothetical protein